MGMHGIQAILLTVLFGYASCQNSNCDFYQYVNAGDLYYVASTNYPSNYTPGIQCRWIAECQTGYNCRLDCTDVTLPWSQSCYMDQLLISKSGDAQLSAADTYCGRGSFTAVSTAQRISIGLITSKNSPGGRFYCKLTTQVASSNNSCSCGEKKQTRIVGGNETGINEYRAMAGIADRSYSIYCGGIIIHQRYVLTAAHCLTDQEPSGVAVVVGEHDVSKNDSIATKAYGIYQITIHPEYNENLYDYDIGILTTSNDIVFGPLVGPVCLPFKFVNTDMTGKQLIVLGWGTTSFGGPKSNVLMEAKLDVMSDSSCKEKEPTLTPRQFCTYTPGKDACQFDSGGPLLYMDPGTGLLFDIGIISKGRGCATGSPGVQTNVRSLLPWIVDNTPGATYCKK